MAGLLSKLKSPVTGHRARSALAPEAQSLIPRPPRHRRQSSSASFAGAAAAAVAAMTRRVDTPPGTDNDSEQLMKLGHVPELKRQHTRLSMLGMAYAILDSNTALSTSLSLALPAGGPTAVLWGLLVASFCNVCTAASLAEFLSVYPTAGGQYHWVAMISPTEWVPLLSWICGWINVSGWVFLVATGGALGSQLIIGIIALTDPTFVVHPWHVFLLYTVITVQGFIFNALCNRLLPLFTKSAFLWSLIGPIVIALTCIICAAPNFQSAKFVFTGVINETGYPTGFAWCLGLLQGALALTGFDSVAHMVEEIPQPSKNARIMVDSVLIGTVTGFAFLTVLLFCMSDVTAVISAPEGPLLRIFIQATNSNAAAIALEVFPIVCLLFATTGIMTTASRMIYAFARDNGLPGSSYLSKVNKPLGVPLNALILCTVADVLIGCLYLVSSSALNAILSASVVALGVSYGFPIAINMCQGRRGLPDDRPYKLPGLLGWAANAVAIVFVSVTAVLFLFPPTYPVTSSNMNYCVIAFACIVVISAVDYLLEGKKRFTGPKVEVVETVQREW